MPKIAPESLMSLEAYARRRAEFRAEVLAHKKNRKVHIGEQVTLIFEDELTIRYQVQEMLRIERIFEEEGIREELEAYNPLVPDGRNFKATMMIEYADAEERKAALAQLGGIAERTWVQVAGCSRVYAIADEDMGREREGKTSSVHFLRFELDDTMASLVKGGASLAVGIDHPCYQATLASVPQAVRDALAADLA